MSLKRWLARATLSCALPGVAFAGPNKSECVDANTEGQELRLHEKVVEARRQFELCANPSCPGLVVDDCKRRLDELGRVTPTVVLVAPAEGASVTMDGVRLPLSSDATGVDVDPGEHTFVFEAPGHPTVTRVVTAKLNDKGRRVAADWSGSQPTASGLTTTPEEKEKHGITSMQTAGIVVGVVGLAGIALGSVFGAASYASWGSVKNECLDAPTCDVTRAASDRNDALAFATGSDVAFAVGAALAVTGIVLFVVGRRHAANVSALLLPSSFALRGTF